MPEKRLVINTGPLLALAAAWGELNILKELYKQVVVPHEVSREILAGGAVFFLLFFDLSTQWVLT